MRPGRVALVAVLTGWLTIVSACQPAGQRNDTTPAVSIYSDYATIVPQQFSELPTMSIRLASPAADETAAPASPTPTVTAPALPNAPSSQIHVEDLALPFDPDEIKRILVENPRLHFRYKHRAFVFPNCSTVTHLGEVMEIFATFKEGDPSAPLPAAFSVYAPADMRILRVWGTNRYRLMLNSRIGINEVNKPAYLSMLTLTRLDESLNGRLAGLLEVAPDSLLPNYSDPQWQLGPFLFSQEYAHDVDDIRAPIGIIAQAQESILVRKGERIGVKDGPWEWYPTCENDHTLSVHVFPTTNDVTDHTQAVETRVPAITYHYLNLVVRELVIERGLTIDVEYRTRNVGHSHARLASELFAPDVLEQVTLIPWLMDRHPRRFTVAPFGEMPLVFDDEME